MAVFSHYNRNPLPHPNSRAMVIAYLLIAVLAYIYVRVIFEAWDYKRKQKAEWNKYWDEVFEKNKYL